MTIKEQKQIINVNVSLPEVKQIKRRRKRTTKKPIKKKIGTTPGFGLSSGLRQGTQGYAVYDSSIKQPQISEQLTNKPITFYSQPEPPKQITYNQPLTNSIMEENKIRKEQSKTLDGYNKYSEEEFFDLGMKKIKEKQEAIEFLKRQHEQQKYMKKVIDITMNDDPTTNNLNNSTFDAGEVHPKLPNVNFGLTTLNANERSNNALTNLVSQQKKSKEQKIVDIAMDDQLLGEYENEIEELTEESVAKLKKATSKKGSSTNEPPWEDIWGKYGSEPEIMSEYSDSPPLGFRTQGSEMGASALSTDKPMFQLRQKPQPGIQFIGGKSGMVGASELGNIEEI
jgi:hypothetical protein